MKPVNVEAVLLTLNGWAAGACKGKLASSMVFDITESLRERFKLEADFSHRCFSAWGVRPTAGDTWLSAEKAALGLVGLAARSKLPERDEAARIVSELAVALDSPKGFEEKALRLFGISPALNPMRLGKALDKTSGNTGIAAAFAKALNKENP